MENCKKDDSVLKVLKKDYFKYFADNIGYLWNNFDECPQIRTLDEIKNNDRIEILKTVEINNFKKTDENIFDIAGAANMYLMSDNVFINQNSEITNSIYSTGKYNISYLNSYIKQYINDNKDDKLFAIVPVINGINFSVKGGNGDFEFTPAMDVSCDFLGWYTASYFSYVIDKGEFKDYPNCDPFPLCNYFTRTYTCITGKNKIDLFKLDLSFNSDEIEVVCNFTKNGFNDINDVVINLYAIPLKTFSIDFIEKYFKGKIV